MSHICCRHPKKLRCFSYPETQKISGRHRGHLILLNWHRGRDLGREVRQPVTVRSTMHPVITCDFPFQARTSNFSLDPAWKAVNQEQGSCLRRPEGVAFATSSHSSLRLAFSLPSSLLSSYAN